LLLLCTYRPERAVAWPGDADLKRIELHALTPDQSQALIGIWMGSLSLSQQLSAAVVERTQGNPFFLEETMRALRERGLVADGEPPLPTTIQGALLARLDQLPLGERYILQIAATIGPLFEHATLAGVTGGQVVLEPTLERLADHGLVRHMGDDRYAFAHSLTQETIYESLLFAQRREIHRRVGDFIRSDREREDTNPGILAYHYRRAEAWPEALEYAWRAGVQAQALYASDIALGHYQQALDAADQLDGAAAQQRPRILRRIGDLHALAGRYSEADAAYAAALVSSVDARERADVLICWAEVCEQQAAYDEALGLLGQAAGLTSDDEPSALRIAVRQAWVLIRQGRAEQALVVVEPCMERLEAQEIWPDLLLAYKVFFHIALSQSRWSKARSYLRLALACAEQAGDIREIARIQNNLGIVLTQEGNLREAATACERAARVMEEIGDRNTLASVQVNLGGIYYKLGDFITALNHYSASLQIAMAIGAPPIESIVRSNLGEIYRRLGRLPESLEQLLASVELCRNMNDDLGLAEAYRQLAETYIALDQLVEAEATCQLAQATAIAAGDPQSEAIVYRVRSLLAAKRGDDEAAFEDARQSTRILAELGSTHELGQSMIVQATILLHEEQCDLASIMLKEAILLLEKAGAAADRMQAEQLLEQVKAQPKEIRP
jgi:predicted ATPase